MEALTTADAVGCAQLHAGGLRIGRVVAVHILWEGWLLGVSLDDGSDLLLLRADLRAHSASHADVVVYVDAS